MSDANLNSKGLAESLNVPERYKRELAVANERSWTASPSSMLAILLGAVSIFGMLAGGVSLLAIKVPELSDLFYPSTADAGNAQSQTEAKTDEELLSDLLQELAREWNSTWQLGVRPPTVYSPVLSTYKLSPRAKGDNLEGTPTENITIKKVRLDGLALREGQDSCIDATFLISRTLTAAEWWKEDGPLYSDPKSVLVVERPVRYSFLARKTQQGWRLTSQYWLGKGSARIRSQEDTGTEEHEIPDITAIPDQRPTFDQAKAVVEARAYSAGLGLLDESSIFSGFTLTLSDETTRTTEELKGRLRKFSGKMNSVQQSSTLLGIAQTDENNAWGMVKNRLDFQPTGSETRNVYSAEWTELVTFNIGTLRAGWRIAKIQRLTGSPILDHYNF